MDNFTPLDGRDLEREEYGTQRKYTKMYVPTCSESEENERAAVGETGRGMEWMWRENGILDSCRSDRSIDDPFVPFVMGKAGRLRSTPLHSGVE